MSILSDRSSRRYLWYRMYLDALCEADPSRMRIRIREAESLLFARDRALQMSPNHREERQALAATLLALRALRECLEPRDLRVA